MLNTVSSCDVSSNQYAKTNPLVALLALVVSVATAQLSGFTSTDEISSTALRVLPTTTFTAASSSTVVIRQPAILTVTVTPTILETTTEPLTTVITATALASVAAVVSELTVTVLDNHCLHDCHTDFDHFYGLHFDAASIHHPSSSCFHAYRVQSWKCGCRPVRTATKTSRYCRPSKCGKLVGRSRQDQSQQLDT